MGWGEYRKFTYPPCPPLLSSLTPFNFFNGLKMRIILNKWDEIRLGSTPLEMAYYHPY